MSKILYLIRHARAEERGKSWPDDRLRPLTREGIRRMEQAVDGLAAIGFEADRILTSPLVRARETAKIIAKRTPGHPNVEEVQWLEPGSTPAAVGKGLEAFARARQVALVGHEPELGEFAAWLVGAHSPLPFRKGAVACFELASLPPKPPARLLWFAPARLLAKIR